jgi:hypothetical protein
MGPTIFLPKTNNERCHNLHKDASKKDNFLTSCEYRQSLLNKGSFCITVVTTITITPITTIIVVIIIITTI